MIRSERRGGKLEDGPNDEDDDEDNLEQRTLCASIKLGCQHSETGRGRSQVC